MRPALPEEETFITEAANVLIDYAKLQTLNYSYSNIKKPLNWRAFY